MWYFFQDKEEASDVETAVADFEDEFEPVEVSPQLGVNLYKIEGSFSWLNGRFRTSCALPLHLKTTINVFNINHKCKT